MSIHEFEQWTHKNEYKEHFQFKDGKVTLASTQLDRINFIVPDKGLNFKIESNKKFELVIMDSKVSTLQPYCPDELKQLTISRCPNIKDLDGATKKLDTFSIINCMGLTSLHNIHKHFESMKTLDFVYFTPNQAPIKKDILGILLIPGLKKITTTIYNKKSDLMKAIKIIIKYIGQGRAGVLAAQSELIEAGLEDYAEI